MPTYAFEGFVLDLDRGSLKHDEREIRLRPQSFAVLCHLVKNARRLISKTELRRAVWGGTVVTDDSLVQCLTDIRRALGDRESLVRTLSRRGYTLDADVAWRPSTVAVLPFLELGGDRGRDSYFGDGVAEELISQLTRVPGLRVASRSSSFRFRADEPDLRAIGTALNVDAVVEGSIRHAAGRFRVSARLVAVPEGVQIWAENYDRPTGDIFSLQDELARAIAMTLRHEYVGAPPLRRRPEHVEAYHLYLMGRYLWNKRDGAGLQKAIGCWEKALQKDPRYALAYSGIADGYTLMAYFGYLAPHDAFPRVKVAALAALAADDDLAEAHVSLANLKLHYEWDFRGAEQEIQRAIALDPGYPHAYHVSSHCWVALGDLAKSLAASRRAMEMDPLDLVLIAHLGWHHLHDGQYEQGVAACKRAIDMEPRFVAAHIYLGQLFTQMRRYEEAVAALERSARLSPASTDVRGHLGLVHALAGRRREARHVRDDLIRQAEQRYVSAYHIGVIHLALGEPEEAVSWLRRAISERSRFMAYIRSDPTLRQLLDERCFADLLKEVVGGQ